MREGGGTREGTVAIPVPVKENLCWINGENLGLEAQLLIDKVYSADYAKDNSAPLDRYLCLHQFSEADRYRNLILFRGKK